MERLVAFAILACVTNVASAACPAHKLSKWGVCNLKAPGSCVQSDCCMEDPRKCKSLSVTCPTGKFKDPAKNGVDPSTATKDPAVDCCSLQKKCADAPCTSKKKGFKNKIGTDAALKCPTDAASCDETTCCTPDDTKCGLSNVNQPCDAATEYANPAANTPDALKSTKTNCCPKRAKCSEALCSSKKKGLKNKIGTDAALLCPTDPASCDENTCCEPDDNKCGVNGVKLHERKFMPGFEIINHLQTGWTEYDSGQDGTTVTATSKNTKCCKPVTAWNKCPAPETQTSGNSGGSAGGSGSGSGGVVGSPSGLDQLKPLTCWRVALFVIMMVSFRG
eukprot:CAMPEP_0172777586 /NCGR_PEP_ID=MMETSP1074-20121228/201474_1 /TAXON_ID=2916 /ORGANISM="Ceratium fusus, Strain PA161109" /LENGTH=333 /DNA_ID=CAMNT_0013614507 /DNA_START=53 /DNA_END=1055 /DNA_ORIENTATION=+